MEPVSADEPDPLSHLEERIRKAAELVSRLRRERDHALKRMEAAVEERDAAVAEASHARAEAAALSSELENLRGERVQVRKRIEKLLGQMDLLGDN